MKTPTVSIILPTYNGERNLADSISSCLSQTFKDFELIIVNDCSTDQTLHIANEFAAKDSRVKIVSNDANKKLPASLNIGFEQSKGDFLTWTSDDNFYKPDALAEMLGQIRKTDADLVYADYDVVDSDKNIIESKKLKGPENLFVYNYVGACFLYKRSVYERLGGYRIDLFCAEDYEYWLRIWSAGLKISHIKKSLYLYSDNPLSLTATKRDVILDKTIKLKIEYVNKVPTSKREKVKVLFRLYRRNPIKELSDIMMKLSPVHSFYLVLRYKFFGK